MTADSRMLERATKAIYERRNGSGAKPWSRLTHSHQGEYIDDAKAVMQAIQEPSEAMCEAGGNAWVDHGSSCPICAAEIYREMMKAALSHTDDNLEIGSGIK